ncbi:leucine-rich repeat domain-containing protein [Faecalicatena sp. BF-R-105]|nr:leucine-rich repeat domain-containing protein [Faecalicatena sp. BF-R-105]
MAYLKPKKGVKGTVKIPDSITVNHVTYKVTEIAANAFKNQKKIRKVVIPSGVSKIGEKAFYGCKNLKNITIKTTKLTKKRVGSKAFSGIHAKAVIKVPKKKLSAYRKMLKARGAAKKENVQAIKVKPEKA